MCFCYHWQADSSSLRSLCWADLAGSWWLSDLYTSLLELTYKICRTILLNYFSNQRVALIFLTIFPSSPSLLLPTPRPSHLPSFSLFWFSFFPPPVLSSTPLLSDGRDDQLRFPYCLDPLCERQLLEYVSLPGAGPHDSTYHPVTMPLRQELHSV